MAADCHVLRFGSGAAADSQYTDLVFQSGSLSTSGIKKMRFRNCHLEHQSCLKKKNAWSSKPKPLRAEALGPWAKASFMK
mgnify:CR=1 FL=1